MNCPCSIWGNGVTPSGTDSGDAASIEVGVKFKTDTFGVVTGIRFYKASTNTGTHIGNLWTSAGQLLASATFTGETASGWQQVNFSQPVPINPNTTYVASYFAPNGHYSRGRQLLLHGAADRGGGQQRGQPAAARAAEHERRRPTDVYTYASSSTFPTSNFDAANYWVDPVFSPQADRPDQVTSVTATAGYASANVSWTAPTSGGAVTTYIITPYIGSVAQTPTDGHRVARTDLDHGGRA